MRPSSGSSVRTHGAWVGRLPLVGRLGRLGVVAGLLLCGTACLEDFRSLVTTVAYDPYENVFHVERVLVDVEASFFQCDAVDTCAEAIARTATLRPSDSLQASLADRLVARLVDTGARNLAIRLERRGDHLDARVTYSAAVGSKAAADTLVHAEWGGKQGREKYYLVLEAQESMAPPDVPHELRKQTLGAAGGGWREFWVLPPKVLEITTRMAVDDEAVPLFASLPGLDEALEARGLLGDGADVAVGVPGVAVATAEPEAVPAGASDESAAGDGRAGGVGEPEPEPEPLPEQPAPVEAGARAPSRAPAQPAVVEQPEPGAAASDPPASSREAVAPEPISPGPEPIPEPIAADPAPVAAPQHAPEPAPRPEPEPAPQPDPRPEPAVASPVAPEQNDPPPVVGELRAGGTAGGDAPAPDHAGAPEAAPEPPPPPTAGAATAWPAPDPDSPARTYVYPVRITGGLSSAVAEEAAAPLVPRAEVCYQRRQTQIPDLAGYAFLNARVRGDGWLVGTSVYGEIGDVQLIRCLEEAIVGWTFPPWGEPSEVAEVDVPLTFRVEEPTGRKRKRRR